MASAVLYAWNLILQRQQAQIASPQEIVLVQNVIMGFWFGLAMPFAGAAMPGDAAMAAPIARRCLPISSITSRRDRRRAFYHSMTPCC